jgi:hypothetical protein
VCRQFLYESSLLDEDICGVKDTKLGYDVQNEYQYLAGTSFPHNKPMASTFRRPKKPIACNLNQVDDVSFRDQSDVTNGIGMDSFSVSTLQMKGTKVWTNGCSLVSTGLRELDALMLSSSGSIGGQPLGTCICLESLDRFWSVLSNCIVRYWCAEVS